MEHPINILDFLVENVAVSWKSRLFSSKIVVSLLEYVKMNEFACFIHDSLSHICVDYGIKWKSCKGAYITTWFITKGIKIWWNWFLKQFIAFDWYHQ